MDADSSALGGDVRPPDLVVVVGHTDDQPPPHGGQAGAGLAGVLLLVDGPRAVVAGRHRANVPVVPHAHAGRRAAGDPVPCQARQVVQSARELLVAGTVLRALEHHCARPRLRQVPDWTRIADGSPRDPAGSTCLRPPHHPTPPRPAIGIAGHRTALGHTGATRAPRTRGERRPVRASARVGPGRGRTRLTPPRYWKRHGRVHLHHAQGPQGPRRQGDPRRRHDRVLPGREDRRRRTQRRRQVERAQDHGGARPAAQRRRVPDAPATPSASSCRSRSSTRTRTSWATSRRASARSRSSSTGTTRSPRRWRSSTPTSSWTRWARLQEEHRPRRRVGPRLPARAGDGRAALPAAGRRRHGALRRRAPPGRAVQAAAEQARPAAARRAHQPPGRRERAVARAAPGRVRRAPCWPSPTTGTSSTTWRSGSSSSTAAAPTPTRATTRPTWRRSRSACRSRARRTPSSPSASRTSSSGSGTNAKGRQTKSKARLARYEEMAAEADRTRKLDFDEIQIPPGPRLGTWSSRRRSCRRASATGCSSTNLSFSLPRNGIVGVIGPNGVGKTTLFKTIVGPGAGRRRRPEGRRDRQDLVRRPVPGRPRPEEERVGDGLRGARLHQGRQRRDAARGRTSRRSASRAPTSRSRPACCPAASATGSTWR